MSARWRELDPGAPGFAAAVEGLWAWLRAAGEPLVPDYFARTTLVKMGGRLLLLGPESAPRALALLFPRGLAGGRRRYTARTHAPAGPLGADERAALAALLAPDEAQIQYPAEGGEPEESHAELGGFDVGGPSAAELPQIRALHGAVWGGGEEARYPDDLHGRAFGPATSLVARREGRLAGFLLGFHRFGGPEGLAAAAGRLGLPHRTDWCVESQVMAVAPEQRRSGLAATLKRAQARDAWERHGLDLIHWTADPLQFANAALNFGRLGAVAGSLYPDYYPFRNELNRVAASRLGVVWLPRSARGRAGMEDGPRRGRELSRYPGAALLNEGPRPRRAAEGAPYIALEIPADWTALQRDDPALAAEWRAASDELLAAQLGFAEGRYLIIDAAAEGERRFLVGARFAAGLLGGAVDEGR